MAWSEQYDKILEQMKKKSVTSNAITGADSKDDEPDCLFYTNFSRETALAFYNIFGGFRDYYSTNPSNAVDRLKNNLKSQIEEMDGMCPIEVVLYASRVIREGLGNRAIKNAIISAIQPDINKNLKSVQYILSGWEWPQILSILIEACGRTNNDETIALAMRYCPKIAQKFVDKNDIEILKSYIVMIENSQNENNLRYLVDIASMPQVEENNMFAEYLVQELKNNMFLKQHREKVAADIADRTVNSTLKRNLEKIIGQNKPRTVDNPFNMPGLSYEIKEKQVSMMDFSMNTSYMLNNFERSRESDEEIVVLTIKKILDDIPKMRLSDKNLAMILVGTKGFRVKAGHLTADIINLMEKYPEIKTCAMFTLYELDNRNFSLEKAIAQLIVDENILDWEWAIGKYIRFRKSYFENVFMRVFQETLSDESSLDKASLMERFYKLIAIFNGNNNLLSTQLVIQNNIFSILENTLSGQITERLCNKLLTIFDFMLNFNSERVLYLLDELKLMAEEHEYDTIIIGVNDLIKKGDLAREPE